jgi:2-dehydro-3-deoxyphosphogalactonate aldolase
MTAEQFLEDMPLVAILRGVQPEQIVAVGETLHAEGVRVIEVPLNSPDPFASIERLKARLGPACLCGGGTVLTPADVRRVHDAGGELVVSPNTDTRVIARTVELGMIAMPGFATASEAFVALEAGASRLKLFPASTYGASHVRALKAVLPGHARLYAVGGIGAPDIAPWRAAGTSGFGFGSEIFKPDYSLSEIAARARNLVAAMRTARG